MAQEPQTLPPNWEREVLEKLVLEGIREQRRARRWSIFFRFLFFAYLVAVTLSVWQPWVELAEPGGKITAKVEVKGILLEESPASAEILIKGLKRAFSDPRAQGIVLQMNSPGGSPVQADSVYRAILKLKAKKPKLPVIAVVTDVCASGCYYIASAADKIYVSPSSVIGSIGVVMNGFGFVEAIAKLGIERRLMTAGEHKALLDPFSPIKPEEKAHVESLLQEVHRQFIEAVKQGRGERLKEDPKLFSGLVWTGSQSVALGLADGIGDVDTVAEEVIGAEKVVDFTPQEDVFVRLARKFGTSLGETLMSLGGEGWATLR
jgi:protease-4